MISTLGHHLQSTSWALKTVGSVGLMNSGAGLFSTAYGRLYVVAEFRKHPECVEFVKAHQEKLVDINVQVSNVWIQAATQQCRFEIRCLLIESIAQLLYNIPLGAFAIQTYPEIGLLGVAVVAVIPLGTLLTKAIQIGVRLYAEDQTVSKINAFIEQLEWLGYIRTLIVPAMIYSNTISQQGLEAGLTGIGKLTLPFGIYFLWKQFLQKPKKIRELTNLIEKMAVLRKAPPSDKDYLTLKALAETKATIYADAKTKREDANMKFIDQEKKYHIVHDLVSDFNMTKDRLAHILLTPDALKYSSKDPLDSVQTKNMILKLKSAYEEAYKEEEKVKLDLDNATKKLKEATELEASSKALYIDIHHKFQTADLLYKEAFIEYDFACKNYRHKIAELRQLKGNDQDELPWLMDYLKMYMEMESVSDLPLKSKEEAKLKLEEAESKFAAEKSKLLVNKDDCLQKHLNPQTIEWLEDYVKEVNTKLTEFKKKWKLA